MTARDPRVSAVVITRDRVDELLECVRRLEETECAHVVVVDNGSSDGSAYRVRARFPSVEVVRLRENKGSAARNIGVALCETPYVAFADDDSAWQPGSLSRAAGILDADPAIALVNARLVLPDGSDDPVCATMAASPLERRGPRQRLLGFVACAAVVRRGAFLDAGGFHPRLNVGGEEELLALDLCVNGWELVYAPDVVAWHMPSQARSRAARRRRLVRNRLVTAWLRRPAAQALRLTCRELLDTGARQPAALAGALQALGDAGWIRRSRQPVPPHADALLRLLGGRPSRAS